MEQLYKGYIPCNGKKSKVNWQDTKTHMTLEEVRGEDSYAGILKEEYLMLDVDNDEAANKVFEIIKDKDIRTIVIKSTRGMHFFFKKGERNIKQFANKVVACGIKCDLRVGGKGYECLKVDGVEREVIHDTGLDVIPNLFFPTQSRDELLGLRDGDGRNDKLWKYILILQKEGFTKEEIKDIYETINDYVLSDPLPIEELETILRSEAFDEQTEKVNVSNKKYFKNKQFLHYDLAMDLIKSGDVKAYGGTIYTRDPFNNDVVAGEDAAKKMIAHKCYGLSDRQRSEVVKDLREYSPTLYKEPYSDPRYIRFTNGVYDIYEGRFVDGDFWIPNTVSTDYIESAQSEVVDRMFTNITLGDKEVEMQLEEMLGSCLFRDNSRTSKIFILTGSGANGKSTLLDAWRLTLGVQNSTAMDLQDFKSVFSTSQLQGMLADIGDDIGADFITLESSARIKKVATGNEVNAQRKGEHPFNFRPYCTLMYSANDIPAMKDDSYGSMRRYVFIPFNYDLRKDPHPDLSIGEKLRTEQAREALLLRAVNGLKRLISNGFQYTYSVKSDARLKKYIVDNDSVMGFIEHVGPDEFVNKEVSEMYSMYTEFCVESGLQFKGKPAFSRKVCEKLELNAVISYATFKDRKTRFMGVET